MAFQYANLRNLLQNLNLEKASNDQNADQKSKYALGLDCPLLRRVTGDVLMVVGCQPLRCLKLVRPGGLSFPPNGQGLPV